ncbi:MAG: SsrA-binding protein SmpB [candidate division SR1 bacterium]|nr:SsrA-binding protein SmpB [candidate division SR1 bacterium]
MKLISKNKHAYHDYQIDKEYEVGIILKGHEVKSIKASHVNIKDSIIRLEHKELWINNMDVPLYEKTSHLLVPGYLPKGKRKILITKKELAKISSALDKSGTTIIPLEIYLNKRGLIKIKIGVGKTLRKVEKKQILKEKDIDRQMKREMKHL